MNFYVMTLFPDMINSCMNESIIGRAVEKGILSINAVNIRDFTLDKHRKVDDYPYGGGAGMLMAADPVVRTWEHIVEEVNKGNDKDSQKKPKTIYLTPWGRKFDQNAAKELAKEEDLIFICGHYEGIDERALEIIQPDFYTIGDYVLTGGELPAMVMMDTVSRLVPGVLNNVDSAVYESFNDNLLEHPQYTRPEEYRGLKVPEVLLSGHHANVEKWKKEKSVERTRKYRPDLLK
ncbi:MAG: tRNA (guanosine(37)-N1)-methyltransferase TrmD [Lachnospiraceae bacterium]|nr:tRNA (guanosine(37)-N1)-methyltransferase TrmD [Lachnospiraceae bacterium]